MYDQNKQIYKLSVLTVQMLNKKATVYNLQTTISN